MDLFLVGTWTGTRYLMPGFAVRDELRALVSAGLTPFEALAAATTNPAMFVERPGEFGRVETGLRADLVLLYRNPLEDIRNVNRRVGVMVHGHWFSESRLRERLEEIAVSYGR